MNAVSGATRVFAVLGDPVAHSRSPAMQNAAFQAAGVNGIYVALRCSGDALASLVRGLSEAGGGGNVTLPYKPRLLDVADEALTAASLSGAGNTFWLEAGRLLVDNTDVEGFRRALARFRPDAPVGQRTLVLGAGGAARAVVAALLAGGADEVTVLNRTPARAAELARDFNDRRLRVVADERALEQAEPDLVVNATRLGLEPGDPLPLHPGRLRGMGALFDVVYAPHPTPLVVRARALGIPVEDGREMLVQQGAAAFERWWGKEAPVRVMRSALDEPSVG